MASKASETLECGDTLSEILRLTAENAMLRETLDAIDGTVSVYTADNRYLFGNQGYHALFPHLPPDSALRGERFEHVLSLSIAAGVVAAAEAYDDTAAYVARRAAEMQDRTVGTRELHNTKFDRWSQMRVKWTPSDNRVALRVDVTEVKRLQRELLRAQRLETIGRVAGGVAHDFNNLLTVIISNLELIQLRPADAVRVRRQAESALTAAETGATLIRQLLTFVRRDVTTPRMLEPNPLLRGMAEVLQRMLGEGITLELALAPDAGRIFADVSQFESAILNLVLNGREAIGDRADGTLTIGTHRAPEDMVAVTVSDNGRGMTADVAAQAFEPFFTTKPIGAGPGLGLSQVYGFATGAGGRVEIDSAVGVGSTVRVLLPLMRD